MNRRRLAVVHTCCWAAANVAEFDRRHLHSVLRWLAGRRQPRMTRPPRRIVSITIGAAWAALVTSVNAPTLAADTLTVALAVAVATLLVARALARARARARAHRKVVRLRNGSWTLNKYRASIGEPPVEGKHYETDGR